MGCCEKVKASGWVLPTAALSLYGFFANCRPAEPFVTPYLVGPYKNLSEEQVTNYLFPIWTYSYLALLIPVFLLTDFLRYKPVIIVQGLFLVTNYVLLCFCQGLTAMTILQVNYAVVTSTEVAYLSYIYSIVPVECYQKATGYVRSAMLAGYMTGASLGQILVSVVKLSLFYINSITLGTVSISFLVSLCLPMPKHGMFFQEDTQTQDCSGSVVTTRSMIDKAQSGWCTTHSIVHAGGLLWRSFLESYSSKQLIYWSLWWALATAGYVQVFNYTQLMWNHIQPSGSSVFYNGGVEAAATLVGAVAAITMGNVKVAWHTWGELALGVFSAVSSGAVFLMGLTSSIWACYVGYVTFKASYMLLITITMFQIAVNLSMECYALTFGINTFIALLIQTILTAIFVDERTLSMDIVSQFLVYGSYYGVISLLFLIRGAYVSRQHCCQHKQEESKTRVLYSQKL